MSKPPDNHPNSKNDEPFLSRWARRKKLKPVPESVKTQTTASGESASPSGDTAWSSSTDEAVVDSDIVMDYVMQESRTGDSIQSDVVDESQTSDVVTVEGIQDSTTIDTVGESGAQTESAEPEIVLSDEDMPPIETLTKDSDVSCFLNKGVSEALRKKALRHLFMLPAFNIRDGLNDYDEDYTTFEPLGDTITSDMKFHAARKAREEEERQLALQQENPDAELDEAQQSQSQPSEAESESESADAEVDETDDESNAKETDVSETEEEDVVAANADDTSHVDTEVDQTEHAVEVQDESIATNPSVLELAKKPELSAEHGPASADTEVT